MHKEKNDTTQAKKYWARLKTYDAGFPEEKACVAKKLVINHKYEIEKMVIYSCYTEVFLKDFEKSFNSVFFDFWDNDGNEFSYLDVPIATHTY